MVHTGMVLRLTDTLTKTKQEIHPAHPDGILRLYHCGPTVYATPHLGNLRRFLAADLLVRVARFLGYRARSVMNITDVGHVLDPTPAADGEDRIVLAAHREGISPEQIAAKYAAEFFSALASVHAEPADYFPRATMHIPQMHTIIKTLVGKGLAYETLSGVYFAVTKFPRYGRLSGNTLQALQVGARIDVREEKRHPADFALWVKAPKEHRLQWDSPWGRGYPGWHIECSAMSMQVLGERIDVHTGGVDNIFPHHENEIAQSDGATGKRVVRHWVHNEHLDLEGGKMAKSEGRVLTLDDLTARGYPPPAFRLYCLQTHYRSKLNFTWEAMDAAASGLRSLREFTERLGERARLQEKAEGRGDSDETLGKQLMTVENRFTEALADDLGSPQALAVLFECMHEMNPALQADALSGPAAETIRVLLRKLDSVLAILDVDAPPPAAGTPPEIQTLVGEREAARRRQEYAAADRLRGEIEARGYRVEDSPDGPRVTKAAS